MYQPCLYSQSKKGSEVDRFFACEKHASEKSRQWPGSANAVVIDSL